MTDKLNGEEQVTSSHLSSNMGDCRLIPRFASVSHVKRGSGVKGVGPLNLSGVIAGLVPAGANLRDYHPSSHICFLHIWIAVSFYISDEISLKMSLEFSPRRTRRQRADAGIKSNASESAGQAPVVIDLTFSPAVNSTSPVVTHDDSSQAQVVSSLSSRLLASDTKLSSSDHKTLLRKQAFLSQYTLKKLSAFKNQADCLASTLVFAQEEAGTAVCVSPTGLLLTCSHCVAETVEDFDSKQEHWLLFASGLAVRTVCVAWDSRRDLALLRITAAQRPPVSGDMEGQVFPFVVAAESPPPVDTNIVCIGHPGSEDLEVDRPGVQTDYDVLHMSTGSFRGYADGQDRQNNEEIGALKHDCWTYWGHSGAPLFEKKTGELVGLHSSWDDTTGMRRGIGLEAINAFLKKNEALF